jgi:ribose transport system permease protein
MSSTESPVVTEPDVATFEASVSPDPEDGGSPHRWVQALSYRNISAIYVWLILIVLFAIWVPETFLTAVTWKSMLAQEAVTGIVALGLVVSLSAGVFDLSIGYALGASSIVCSWCLVQAGTPIWVAVVAALGTGLVVGLMNGVLIVGLGIDSFIATLGTGAVLSAFIGRVTKRQMIVGVPHAFQNIAKHQLVGLALPVFYFFVIAAVLWYVLEHTPAGRYLYATGGGREAARLAGVRTNRYIFGSLIAGSFIAALAGVIVTSRVNAGDPSIGPAYLLPAFAAAFFGATQFKNGRPNVWGTVVAVYVIATGVKGFDLVGVDPWIKDLFTGLALIIAVGLSVRQRRIRVRRPGSRRIMSANRD